MIKKIPNTSPASKFTQQNAVINYFIIF